MSGRQASPRRHSVGLWGQGSMLEAPLQLLQLTPPRGQAGPKTTRGTPQNKAMVRPNPINRPRSTRRYPGSFKHPHWLGFSGVAQSCRACAVVDSSVGAGTLECLITMCAPLIALRLTTFLGLNLGSRLQHWKQPDSVHASVGEETAPLFVKALSHRPSLHQLASTPLTGEPGIAHRCRSGSGWAHRAFSGGMDQLRDRVHVVYRRATANSMAKEAHATIRRRILRVARQGGGILLPDGCNIRPEEKRRKCYCQ